MGLLEFLATIGLAALSALTWVAYQHAPIYDKMWKPLLVVNMLVFVGGGMFVAGASWSLREIAALTAKPPEEIAALVPPPFNLAWLFIGFLAISLYLIFLSMFRLIGLQPQRETK